MENAKPFMLQWYYIMEVGDVKWKDATIISSSQKQKLTTFGDFLKKILNITSPHGLFVDRCLEHDVKMWTAWLKKDCLNTKLQLNHNILFSIDGSLVTILFNPKRSACYVISTGRLNSSVCAFKKFSEDLIEFTWSAFQLHSEISAQKFNIPNFLRAVYFNPQEKV